MTVPGVQLSDGYTVTELLRRGSNELRLVLSAGWYRGRHGYLRVSDNFGDRTTAVARLEADD